MAEIVAEQPVVVEEVESGFEEVEAVVKEAEAAVEQVEAVVEVPAAVVQEAEAVVEPSDNEMVVSRPFSTNPEDDEEAEMDESLLERLLGLTEMFPECVRSASVCVVQSSSNGVKNFYSFACSSSWIFFSSASILMAPLIFEVERCQMDEMHKQQQRQILLGPNAAVSGSVMPPQAMR